MVLSPILKTELIQPLLGRINLQEQGPKNVGNLSLTGIHFLLHYEINLFEYSLDRKIRNLCRDEKIIGFEILMMMVLLIIIGTGALLGVLWTAACLTLSATEQWRLNKSDKPARSTRNHY